MEARLNELEHKINTLEKGKAKQYEDENSTQRTEHLEQIETELMNIENNSGLICNEDKDLSTD